MTALALATLCILVRSIFRVAELSEGFNGKLANQQITFTVLEGAMVVLAAGGLTAFHPGFAMGHAWHESNLRVCSCGGGRKQVGKRRGPLGDVWSRRFEIDKML